MMPPEQIARNAAIRDAAARANEEWVRRHIWALEDDTIRQLYDAFITIYGEISQRLISVFMNQVPGDTWQTTDPGYRLLCEEIFGPVVTAYVYDDATWQDTMTLVDATSPYALTGAVFAQDRRAIVEATSALRNAAGNFYVNDKPTGAVVGQQPFGGARASGTNDKAGSKLNLIRWVSARTIKENFNPPTEYKYPFMNGE